MPPDVVLRFGEVYAALSDLSLEDLRFSKSWDVDDGGIEQGAGDVYQACVIVVELTNQEYDSVVIPMVKKNLVDPLTNLISHTSIEDLVQLMITYNLSPRHTEQVVGLVGAYYGLTKILNQ
jgi:hypothetical protein